MSGSGSWKKQRRHESMEEAHAAISARQLRATKFAVADRFALVKQNVDAYESKVSALKERYAAQPKLSARRASVRAQYRAVKGSLKYWRKQYDDLKTEVGYESPSDSSDDSSVEMDVEAAKLAASIQAARSGVVTAEKKAVKTEASSVVTEPKNYV